tara:strand:- start:311 stop:610 length:300 start_codon:yes stop_codon:yes gene_type:complete
MSLRGKMRIFKAKATSVTLDSITFGTGRWKIKGESNNLNIKVLDSSLLSVQNDNIQVDMCETDSVTFNNHLQIGTDWKIVTSNNNLYFDQNDSTAIKLS